MHTVRCFDTAKWIEHRCKNTEILKFLWYLWYSLGHFTSGSEHPEWLLYVIMYVQPASTDLSFFYLHTGMGITQNVFLQLLFLHLGRFTSDFDKWELSCIYTPHRFFFLIGNMSMKRGLSSLHTKKIYMNSSQCLMSFLTICTQLQFFCEEILDKSI